MALLPTNKRDQLMLVAVIGALGVGYLYYDFLWKPKATELDLLRARVDTLEIQNEQARRDIARGTAGKVREEAEHYRRLLGVMRQLVPTANEVPALLEQVSTAARQTGLDISGVTPLGVIPGDVFDTYRYRVSVTGSYHRISQFLNNVGALTRIVAPMNLQLNPTTRTSVTRRTSESALDASFEIQTYVAKTAPPTVAPATGTN
jgi:type IV pilus assembly protein PilO